MFINPLLLFGLALVSAPVIIHILNKRRYRVHDWAAMDVLLAAQVSNRRRVKFEDLILLLLRMAIIGFLVMAVARPVLKGMAGSKEDTRVVVLDDSFSMAADFGTGKVFKVAQDSVVNQVQDALGGSIPVSVWLGSRPGKTVGKVEGEVQGGVVERDQASEASSGTLASLAAVDLLDSVPELRTSDLELDFARILRRLIDEAKNSPVPRVRSVVLVSDYRDRDWFAEDGSLKDSLAVLFEEIVREETLKNSFNFQFVDVSSGSVDNTALTGFSIESDPVLAGVPVRIAVEVTNYGKAPRVRVEGNIEVGGAGSGEFEARHKISLPMIESIPPGETVRVEIQHIFAEGGEYPPKASISPDLLDRDDESTLVVVVRDSLQVAVVDGAPSANRFASESGLLRAALSPRGDVPSGVSTLMVEGELDSKDLANADCVFILNRSSISSAERDALGDFARSGGGIAYFLGNKIDVNSYLSLARPLAGEPPLFPAILKEPAPPGALHLGFADFGHPTLELFRGLKTPSFSHVVFRRFFLLDPLPGAKVVGSFDDELSTAAVIEARYFLGSAPSAGGADEASAGEEKKTGEPAAAAGRGRLAVFNTSADRDWGDWPTDYTYPILM
ncbi:MAG: BatA domain-containing protein, partial [Planctomycetota bacterium]